MEKQYLDLQVLLVTMAVLELWDKREPKEREETEETLANEVRMANPVSVAHQDYPEKKVPLDHKEPMAYLETKEKLVLLAHQAHLAYKVPLA